MAEPSPTYLRNAARQVDRSPAWVSRALDTAPEEVQADVESRNGMRILGVKAIAWLLEESDLRPRKPRSGRYRKTVPSAH